MGSLIFAAMYRLTMPRKRYLTASLQAAPFIWRFTYLSKYEIAIVPTIVVFDDGEEVKRFQADISFKMVATRKEVQEYIDELIISKF